MQKCCVQTFSSFVENVRATTTLRFLVPARALAKYSVISVVKNHLFMFKFQNFEHILSHLNTHFCWNYLSSRILYSWNLQFHDSKEGSICPHDPKFMRSRVNFMGENWPTIYVLFYYRFRSSSSALGSAPRIRWCGGLLKLSSGKLDKIMNWHWLSFPVFTFLILS